MGGKSKRGGACGLAYMDYTVRKIFLKIDTARAMKPPTDQRIVDDFFKLSTGMRTKSTAWLFGMVATYGVKPEQLQEFTWGPSNSILIEGRKSPVKPLHPHWVVIFNLKKQPRKIQDRLENLTDELKIKCDLKELLGAHKDRKKNYYDVKREVNLAAPIHS